MYKFELKRIFRGKEFVGLLISILILVMASFINTIFVQPMYDGDNSLVLDFYQAVSQLMPMVFAPVIGNYFTKDYENKALFFYRNQGISTKQYFFTRLISFILIGAGINFLICAFYLLFRKINIGIIIFVDFVIVLAFVYSTLLISVVAICSKKRMFTIIGAIAGTIIISLVNILPIPYLKGNWFLLDYNSHVAGNMEKFIKSVNDFNILKILMPFFVWIGGLILIIIALTILQERRKEKR